ncbi:nucleoside triphosphate pyrophosphohydrolase [Candidatus Woesearchaeota archaeon]|nr:nucleoside triphosphate pyrophosphohydrolase [Candidatus Woesearchaeota archaeon]
MAKLVRDKIPVIIEKSGKNARTHIADKDEYERLLKTKLVEEAAEFSKEPSIEELADVLEVVYALCDLLRIDKKQLEEMRRKKADERGAFANRIVLEEVH